VMRMVKRGWDLYNNCIPAFPDACARKWILHGRRRGARARLPLSRGGGSARTRFALPEVMLESPRPGRRQAPARALSAPLPRWTCCLQGAPWMRAARSVWVWWTRRCRLAFRRTPRV